MADNSFPFLRLPPFPRTHPAHKANTYWETNGMALAALLRAERVGGTFWGPQPTQHRASCDLNAAEVLPGADPWHLVEQAHSVVADGDSELALVAALLGKPLRVTGPGRFAALADGPKALPAVVAETVAASAMVDPFTGAQTTPEAVIRQLGAWRRLIDANRSIGAVFGVARWKRVTADALLWDGSGPVRHRASARDAPDGSIAWRSRTAPALLAALAARGIVPGEVEDGFIRSVGLGANCVPPLSLVVDRRGIYFDPSASSDLEVILAEAEIGPELTARAAALRTALVAGGISKYAVSAPHDLPASTPGTRRRVLVTGQVEDDRSILTGGAGMTNLALLARAREAEPDAEIVFKPHPDVEAGHRKGAVPDAKALQLADRIERQAPITALLDWADAVHVITSLAGFEALLRGRAVTCHGVPFYAGWGLTTDCAPVPARRGRARTLDQLVAATLILYPRYCDPVTRLPCPPELLVERMAQGRAKVSSPLVVMREWQGRLLRAGDRVRTMLRR